MLPAELIEYVTAGSTVVLALVTIALAYFTRNLAAATNAPFVVYYLKSSDASSQSMDQRLVNTGSGTAFDIIARMSPDLPDPGGEGRRNTQVRNVSLLPPGEEVRFYGTMGRFVHGQRLEVEVSWSRRPSDKKRESITYSCNAEDGFSGGWNVKGIHQLVGELEKLVSIAKNRLGKQ